jgi:hypothetical protein
MNSLEDARAAYKKYHGTIQNGNKRSMLLILTKEEEFIYTEYIIQ